MSATEAVATTAHSPTPEPGVRRPNLRRQRWEHLSTDLAVTLGCLARDYVLVLSTRHADDPYYVQFSADGPDGMRVEAVSNRFLHGWRRLDHTAEGRLRRLGWRTPVDIGEGSPNWSIHHPHPVSFEQLAELAVATFTKALDVARVEELVYDAFSRTGPRVLLPALGVDTADNGTSLAERVDAVIGAHVEVDQIIHDEDGDIPIRTGDAMTYVRTLEESGVVLVFSPLLTGVDRTMGLLEALNDVNENISTARIALTDDRVTLSAQVDDGPGLHDRLLTAYETVSRLAEHHGPLLQAQFGGATPFGDPAEAPPAIGVGLYL